MVVNCHVVGNLIEPTGKPAPTLLVVGQRLPGLQKDLLGEIFGILRPSYPEIHVAVDRVQVPQVQRTKGVGITGNGVFYQGSFVVAGVRHGATRLPVREEKPPISAVSASMNGRQ
jgi:hypothetical protein